MLSFLNCYWWVEIQLISWILARFTSTFSNLTVYSFVFPVYKSVSGESRQFYFFLFNVLISFSCLMALYVWYTVGYQWGQQISLLVCYFREETCNILNLVMIIALGFLVDFLLHFKNISFHKQFASNDYEWYYILCLCICWHNFVTLFY